MDQPSLPLQISPSPRRRGRPPGARNKRSIDLARYIEATFAGATPGQQSAQACMVTPRDLKDAKRLAQELAIIDVGLQPLMLAMVVKAAQLARALSCERKEAWLLLAKERGELMAYVHQKQPQAPEGKGRDLATVFLIPDGEAGPRLVEMGDDEGDIEFLEDFGVRPDEVGRAKSDVDLQPLGLPRETGS